MHWVFEKFYRYIQFHYIKVINLHKRKWSRMRRILLSMYCNANHCNTSSYLLSTAFSNIKIYFPFCLFNCAFPMDINVFYCRMSRHEQFNLREKRVLIQDMLFVIPKRNNSIAFLSTSICFIWANFRTKTNISWTTWQTHFKLLLMEY